jgi:hypothetical protein
MCEEFCDVMINVIRKYNFVDVLWVKDKPGILYANPAEI